MIFERMAGLERRIRAAVAARRVTDPNPDDPFRGLYLSDEVIEALLDSGREPFAAFAETTADGRLGRLARKAQLSEVDVELLLVALAPDVDSRFEQFYGYLNDDVTRRRATVGLALRLCGLAEASSQGRARLDHGSPLVRCGLITVEDSERPLLSRSLRVPDRVGAHLLGDDRPDPLLTDFVTLSGDPVPMPGAERLARGIERGVKLVYLREHPGGGAAELAVSALARAGFPALLVDAARMTDALAVTREALLRGAGVTIGPVDSNFTLDPLLHDEIPVIAYGPGAWEPRWTRMPPLQHDAVQVPFDVRVELWRTELDGKLAHGIDPAEVTAHFVLGPTQISRAANAATVSALADDGLVDVTHLRAGARSQNAGGLQRLARRIEPAVSWPDLVLPAPITSLLRELAARAKHRDRVIDEWRMRPGGGRGRGVTALFAGDSGTGKTMSAEVIAASLGLDLYTVNLATVVDKYVGETEKNLERIFVEAAGVNGVLLFDEADAIFGKRSEVRDAHDRYANIESAYLLQRMESFDGIAVLTTNLRSNMDEAFTRRIDVIADFPVPDEEQRLALWDRCLGQALPRAGDLDLAFCAERFDLAGGSIRACAVTAAYLAAAADRPVAMADVVAAVHQEYRKLGRLVLESEFGRWLAIP